MRKIPICLISRRANGRNQPKNGDMLLILCCGEALIDMIPDQTVLAEPCFIPKVGGAVFNTAIALGRLSSDVALFTGVSNDLFGQMIQQELQNSRVKTTFLSRRNNQSSLAFVRLENGQADYTFYTQNAADTTLTPQDCPDDAVAFDALFFGGISLCTDPTATTMHALMRKRAATCVTMLDPNIRPSFITDETSYRARLTAMIALCDILKLSDQDLNWLVPATTDPAAQIERLTQGANKLVIVTKGENGATAFQGKQILTHVPALKVNVTDTVGAGDTFNAGLLHHFSKSKSLTKRFCAAPDEHVVTAALTFAAKASAITVSRKGANPPWFAELDISVTN
jgi:fructokinase